MWKNNEAQGADSPFTPASGFPFPGARARTPTIYADWQAKKLAQFNSSFTLRETHSGTDSDSDPILLVDSWDWNLHLTLCSVKTSALCNVATEFRVWTGSPNPAV